MGLSGGPPDARSRQRLEAALAALRGGNSAKAERLFRKGLASADPRPCRLGLVYTDLARGRFDPAREALERLVAEGPDWASAIEARADLDAASDHRREALEGYRRLRRLLPDDARAADRQREVRGEVV